ncbi:hypothetical protein [Paenibacillus thiaminolyticus]|uniref:Uncharacterized protein n=1 Tax=Paenibacillus thiaminolyticus TaxID=49283 RepID=A0A3A3GH40_PANTH|nr:hypothetical protein [Paenibacillus thiaminolyticus]RJG21366.1 hypothetical protein DQX05_21960 [Paenibacillus thiaminolyticus]
MQKEVNFEKATPEEAKKKGYKKFNGCMHYLVDMSHLTPKDEADWMNTISIKLPNDRYVTVCVMQPGLDQSCLDIFFHTDENHEDNVRAICLAKGKFQKIEGKGLYTIIIEGNMQN